MGLKFITFVVLYLGVILDEKTSGKCISIKSNKNGRKSQLLLAMLGNYWNTYSDTPTVLINLHSEPWLQFYKLENVFFFHSKVEKYSKSKTKTK